MQGSLMPRSHLQKSQIVILGSLLLLLGGCACLTGYNAYPVISSPQASLLNKRITHLVKIDSKNESETIIAVLEMYTDKTLLVGLTSTGITLFTLEYTTAHPELNTSALFSDNIEPVHLMTALQLVNYHESDITRQLPDDWSLDNDGKQRFLKHKETTRLNTTFFTDDSTSNEPVIVNNADCNYTLTITRLSIEDTQ
jgi:hypothetical protein